MLEKTGSLSKGHKHLGIFYKQDSHLSSSDLVYSFGEAQLLSKNRLLEKLQKSNNRSKPNLRLTIITLQLSSAQLLHRA